MSTSRPRPDAATRSTSNRGPAAADENRRALIAAAREIYSEDGPDAPFNAVAKRAGVGQGTLYRHFPDRLALAAAVFDENIAELEDAMREGGTIAVLFERVIDQASVSTAFIRLLSEQQNDQRARDIAARFEALLDRLRQEDQAAGRIGIHVEQLDVEIAVSMLAHELAFTPPERKPVVADRARRLFALAFAPR
ncbi:TetR/AcrR family transcriptional regulator [Microbacterium stercoris]|uniref:TetR/AcrR family transcriptional regulator n=1 Tax=Microbacterium stercoris TaxID=2820289 RepID=A0A939TPQ7_9MICO|nr:TetR/AcrR family transcriptional regulator [Microbacterium stercoris]MBO3662655.1 TetR/AcrR family transcriptional regulator [Microbacterium stercoris]